MFDGWWRRFRAVPLSLSLLPFWYKSANLNVTFLFSEYYQWSAPCGQSSALRFMKVCLDCRHCSPPNLPGLQVWLNSSMMHQIVNLAPPDAISPAISPSWIYLWLVYFVFKLKELVYFTCINTSSIELQLNAGSTPWINSRPFLCITLSWHKVGTKPGVSVKLLVGQLSNYFWALSP